MPLGLFRHALPGLLCCGALAPPAQAGLSLEQALQRHRERSELKTPGSTDLPALSDGLTLAVGNELGGLPQLLTSPLGTGGSGLHALHTLADGSRGARVRLGVLVREEASRHVTLAGTEVSLRAGAGEAYASHQTRHWGPAWSGSLILDAAAPSLPAVGWRKTEHAAFETPWLSWLGPWNADFFIGRPSGHAEPARPYLVGMRVEVQPLESLRLGASRTMQWGGSGRDQRVGSLLRGFAGRDNQGGTADEPGNQLAGFDAYWSLPFAGARQWAVYGQAIGEDENAGLPNKHLALGGVEWASRYAGYGLRLFLEHANLNAGDAFSHPNPGVAYRHHIYRQGYTHEGRLLGHPAGGDVRLTAAGLLVDAGAWSGLLIGYDGRAQSTAQLLPPGNISGLNAAWSWKVQPGMSLGAGLWQGRASGQRNSAAQLWWQHAWP